MKKYHFVYASIGFCFFIGMSLGLLPFNTVTAQSRDKVEIFLKDGTVLFGSIIHDDTSKMLKVANECGIWQINKSNIDSISTKSLARQSGIKPQIGLFNLSSVALLFGKGQEGDYPYASITSMVGYQWHKNFMAGLGIGFEHYNWTVVPVFGQFMYYFNNNTVAPFLSGKIGYSIPIEKYDSGNNNKMNTHGGVLINHEAGIDIHLNNNSSLLFSLGYAYQEVAYDDVSWYFSDNQSTKKVYTHVNRISFRVGFRFN